MTNEQILEKQVEALEKLLQLRSAIIEELEIKVSNLENEIAKQNLGQYPYPGLPGITTTPWIGQSGPLPYMPQYGGNSGVITIQSPFNCPDGTPHQYPNTWGGTQPANCQKCGYNPQNAATTITCQNGGVITATPVHTSGYVAPMVHATGLVQPIDPNDANNVFTLLNAAK